MNKRTLTIKTVPPQGAPINDVINRVCENCRWFNPDFGDCRQRPPYINEPTGMGIWPKVSQHDWCGQFKRLSLAKVDGDEK